MPIEKTSPFNEFRLVRPEYKKQDDIGVSKVINNDKFTPVYSKNKKRQITKDKAATVWNVCSVGLLLLGLGILGKKGYLGKTVHSFFNRFFPAKSVKLKDFVYLDKNSSIELLNEKGVPFLREVHENYEYIIYDKAHSKICLFYKNDSDNLQGVMVYNKNGRRTDIIFDEYGEIQKSSTHFNDYTLSKTYIKKNSAPEITVCDDNNNIYFKKSVPKSNGYYFIGVKTPDSPFAVQKNIKNRMFNVKKFLFDDQKAKTVVKLEDYKDSLQKLIDITGIDELKRYL